jgi:MFS family permease
MVGLSFLLYSIPFIMFGARGGRIADQRGARTMALIGITCAAPVVCLYGLLTNAWFIVLLGTVEGLVGAIALPAAQSMMARAAPEGRAAAAQGLMGAGDLSTAAIVALIAPMIYGSAGPEVTFAVAAGAMVVLGLLVAYESREVRS